MYKMIHHPNVEFIHEMQSCLNIFKVNIILHISSVRKPCHHLKGTGKVAVVDYSNQEALGTKETFWTHRENI